MLYNTASKTGSHKDMKTESSLKFTLMSQSGVQSDYFEFEIFGLNVFLRLGDRE